MHAGHGAHGLPQAVQSTRGGHGLGRHGVRAAAAESGAGAEQGHHSGGFGQKTAVHRERSERPGVVRAEREVN